MRFIATAEHTQGQSVGHPCSSGSYDDPTDGFQAGIDCESLDAARAAAQAALEGRVESWPACECGRRAGSDPWWESVAIQLWPQDDGALAAWVADGGDPERAPYGLIPNSLDKRMWAVVSDHLGNDSGPYTTHAIFSYCEKCNAERADDDDWTPFQLRDHGGEIVDVSRDRGDGYRVAVLVTPHEGDDDE